MKKQENVNISKAVKSIGVSARRKAFRRNMPVAISENGQVVLLFPDGTRKPATSQAMQELKDAKA